jgi:hypothetical protein
MGHFNGIKVTGIFPGSEYRTIIGEFYCRPKGTALIKSTQIRWFSE